MSTSPYRTVGTGNSAALNAHNQEHHNWGNCQRHTHPEFNNEELVVYANSTAGRTTTTRRAAEGLPDLPHIDKTYPAPINNVPAAGYAGGGGRFISPALNALCSSTAQVRLLGFLSAGAPS